MIILDFDGVLIDSVDEVIVTSYCALTGNHTLSLNDIPLSYQQHFRRNRYHIQPADDLMVLGRWCLTQNEHNPSLLTRKEFEDLRSSSLDSAEARRTQFFNTRKKLASGDRSQWVHLNRPYAPLWSVVKKYLPTLTILTNKNTEAVLEIIRAFGGDISTDQIFSGESGATKAENFHRICAQFPQQHYYFIDDSIHNLHEMRRDLKGNPLLTLGLATWGYVGEDDVAAASTNDFSLVTQDSLIELLTSPIPQ